MTNTSIVDCKKTVVLGIIQLVFPVENTHFIHVTKPCSGKVNHFTLLLYRHSLSNQGKKNWQLAVQMLSAWLLMTFDFFWRYLQHVKPKLKLKNNYLIKRNNIIMKEIDRFKQLVSQVQSRFPATQIGTDYSETENGSSWVDLTTPTGRFLTIEYAPNKGFGLYLEQSDDYGVGPDEVYRNSDALLRRLNMLLNEDKEQIGFKDIRELLGVSQQDLAQLMGQKQPSISKLENRDDIHIQSMIRFIQALGGRVDFKVHFSEFDVNLSLKK
jgi:hypothetical protein